MTYFKKSVTLFGILVVSILILIGCKGEDSETTTEVVYNARISSVYINSKQINNNETKYDLPSDSVVFLLHFSSDINTQEINPEYLYISNGIDTSFTTIPQTTKSDLSIKVRKPLEKYTKYTLYILKGKNLGVNIVQDYQYSFVTEIDTTGKLPLIPYDDLLTLVQRQTFNYFWGFGHPTSGMARERSSSGDVVTTGGTGFGIMAMIVAIERGFISRQEGLDRIQKIVNFLDNKCTKYHGAFAHWLNGSTGATVPFSQYDDGADLVETAFLFEGLLSAQQYFAQAADSETQLRSQIDRLWRAIEWTWFQKDGTKSLYWHWSPNYGWQMNMKVAGWNEALIVYVLAASSPTYPISKDVYTQGWTSSGTFANGKTFYGYQLPLGEDYGGPLFLSHYSFLGLNPKKIKDSYADYWVQNRNHSLINYTYCSTNPKGFAGYSASCWGLTASDERGGYAAHSPTNDNGTITPTAALSSMPYTPDESKKALEFFYYKLGDKIWKSYGFVDAFNLSQGWYSDQFLAIDQGPVVVMIENYRSSLLWNTFMSSPYIASGLSLLGFTVS